MSRFLVVSFQPYRTYHLELRDGGGTQCAVVIHPPAGKGDAQQVPQATASATLAELMDRAKGMIDAVLGPRPPPRALAPRPGYPSAEAHRELGRPVLTRAGVT
jgi:hypothetical protein